MDKDRFQALAFAHGLTEEALLEVCETLEKNGWQPPVDLSNWKQKGPSTLIIDERKPSISQGLSLESSENTEFDRYEVLGKIGEGGMGEVYRVYDPKLNRHLALKCMSMRIIEYEHTVTQFIEEAQLTAQLHHPGIIPVHDFGKLKSGQFYFTMPIIHGRTLRSVIKEVFSKKNGPDSNWNQRRLLEVFRQACDTIGYAHARGVIHCDIKPDNIMIGKFGEVYVLDWGVAQTLGRVSELAPVQIRIPGSDPINTSFTPMMGTPQYMSPEQAESRHEDLNAQSDVYSLGLVLYHILCGKKAYPGSGSAILERVKKGERDPLEGPLPITENLKEIYAKATAFEPEKRYLDAGEMARELGLWLDGIKKQERAMKLVDNAIDKLPAAEKLAKEARAKFDEAQSKLAKIPIWFPEEKKWDAWSIEDEAVKLDLKAHQLELDFRLILHSALSHDPDLVEAHRYLADYYQQCHIEAEAEQNSDMVQRMEGMLRLHAQALPETHIARVRHAAYLKGHGALTIFTEPEGAQVTLFRCEEKNRHLTPVKYKEFGSTPIIEAPLPSGSYIAEITTKGYGLVHYPFTIERLGHWDGVPPGKDWPQTIRLPKSADLTRQDAYVPQGWFQCGSNRSPGAFSPQKVWVDAFIMKKEPVTNSEYIAFLNDLLKQGKEELALSVAPRDKSGITGADAPLIYGRDKNGLFHLTRDTEGDLWLPGWPVVMVDWQGAREYAKWMSEKTGLPWRLPFELEWEKAARGTDGRHYPWGNTFVPTRCNNRHSVEKRPLPAVSNEYPLDKGPYGLLGMAGNVSDWCLDTYSKDPNINEWGQAITKVIEGEPQSERIMRGGSWVGSHEAVSLGRRLGNLPISRLSSCGIRLCRHIIDKRND